MTLGEFGPLYHALDAALTEAGWEPLPGRRSWTHAASGCVAELISARCVHVTRHDRHVGWATARNADAAGGRDVAAKAIEAAAPFAAQTAASPD